MPMALIAQNFGLFDREVAKSAVTALALFVYVALASLSKHLHRLIMQIFLTKRRVLGPVEIVADLLNEALILCIARCEQILLSCLLLHEIGKVLLNDVLDDALVL